MLYIQHNSSVGALAPIHDSYPTVMFSYFQNIVIVGVGLYLTPFIPRLLTLSSGRARGYTPNLLNVCVTRGWNPAIAFSFSST